MPQLSLHTPLGPITVSAEADAIVAVDWGWGRDQNPVPLLLRAKAWLHAYFDGEIEPMMLSVAPSGTAYRQRVWSTICAIAPGKTLSYQDVARLAGGSPRSVGGAMAANPVPILVPCHRVVGTGRSVIGGYSGGEGIVTKRFLLDLERRAVAGAPVAANIGRLDAELSRNPANGSAR